jgi:hypothetical protein
VKTAEVAIALVLAMFLAALLAACESSNGGVPTRFPIYLGDETREPDCRPTTDHVPYEVSLPTYLPHGMQLEGVCLHPPPPIEGLFDLQVVDFGFGNARDTAGFSLHTTPVDLAVRDEMTPVAVGGRTLHAMTTPPRDDGSTVLEVQLRRGDVTYILVTITGSGNELTEDELLRIAESIQ